MTMLVSRNLIMSMGRSPDATYDDHYVLIFLLRVKKLIEIEIEINAIFTILSLQYAVIVISFILFLILKYILS